MTTMNPPLHIEFAAPDPGENPLNLTQLFELATNLVSGNIEGSYTPYVRQNGTPDVEDQDKVWFELDTAGRPKAVKVFYSGSWRRVYNGMLGEIRMYVGNPTDNFDTTGKGKIGGEYDGWALCNGKNGAADLTDSFIVSAHMNDSDGHTHYDTAKGGWVTFVDGKDTKSSGGTKGTMIQMKNLPPLDTSVPSAGETTGLWIHGKGWKDDAEHLNNPFPIVDVNYGNLRNYAVKLTTYGSDPTGNPPVPQEEFPTLPPFIALGFIQFIGYT